MLMDIFYTTFIIGLALVCYGVIRIIIYTKKGEMKK